MRKKEPKEKKHRGSKEEDRLAFGRLRERIEKHDPPKELAADESLKEFASMEPDLLLRWLKRLFQEGQSGERERILRWSGLLLGGKAAPFLKEVVRAERNSLAEKKSALDALRRLESESEEPLGRALDDAWSFVSEEFSSRMKEAGDPDGLSSGVWERFQRIPKEFSDAVLLQLVDQDSVRALLFLDFLLDQTGALSDAVWECVGDVQSEEAARFLESAHHKITEKSMRKKIKKINHKRRAKGLPFCDFDTETTGRAVWTPPVPPEPAGLLSLSESPEARMVWVIRHNVPKGMLVYGGWLHDGQGLIKFFLLDVSQRDAEKYKASVLNNPELTVVEADPAYCAFLLEDAYGKGAPRDPQEDEIYKGYRVFLRELCAGREARHPIRVVFQDPEDSVVTDDPLGESAALLKHKFLAQWRMDLAPLKPHLEKLEEITESRIIVHPMQKRERTEAFYREVTQKILSDATFRDVWRRRVEDMAWVLYKTGEETLAKRLFRVGRHLGDAGRDCSRVTFFTQMVQATFEGVLKEKKTTEKATPSLIVKPG